MQQAGTVTCPSCGNPVAAGKKFCNRCGTALPAGAAPTSRAVTTPAAPRTAAPALTPAAAVSTPAKGFSIWWLIVPTAVFAFLSRDPVMIGVVAAIGVGLWLVKTRPLPANAPPWAVRLHPFAPFAPAVQIPVVFVFLGGNPIVVGLLVVLVVLAVRHRLKVLAALEPWWNLQASIPPAGRKALAFAVPLITGYYFGRNAGGREWTYTLISVSVGVLLAFLLLFTPPDHLRQRKRA